MLVQLKDVPCAAAVERAVAPDDFLPRLTQSDFVCLVPGGTLPDVSRKWTAVNDGIGGQKNILVRNGQTFDVQTKLARASEKSFFGIYLHQPESRGKVCHAAIHANGCYIFADECLVAECREILYVSVAVEQVDVGVFVNKQQAATLIVIRHMRDVSAV